MVGCLRCGAGIDALEPWSATDYQRDDEYSGASTLRVERETVELHLPVLDGPSDLPAPALPPSTGKDAHAASDADGGDAPVIWRFEDDTMARETRAVTGYGSSYGSEFGARIDERYEGTVAVSKDDPAAAWAHGEAVYRIAWPETTVRTEAKLDIRSDADAYTLWSRFSPRRSTVRCGTNAATSGRSQRQLQ